MASSSCREDGVVTTPENQPVKLTPDKVRHLSVSDLGLTLPASEEDGQRVEEIEMLDADDPILLTARDLLSTYGGIIFVGPPGTSKSWYAARLAVTLAEDDRSFVRFVQFHPSYQYEDFVEGFVPMQTSGGFKLVPKHFLEFCRLAETHTDKLAVIVIDELSRGDPGRVFGEALTYIEKSKRGLPFNLASGTLLHVPPNLVVLATMNALDRGVDDVDAALDRRFAKIAMDPSPGLLAQFLNQAGMSDSLRDRVLTFFRRVNDQSRTNPYAALGHTYFIGVSNEDGLRRVWEHQLRFHFDKAFRLDAEGRADIDRMWNKVLAIGEESLVDGPATPQADAADTESPS